MSSESIDRHQNFLFNDGSFHTVLEKGKQYIRTCFDENRNAVIITSETKEEYHSNKTEKDIAIFSMLRDIRSFLTRFRYLIYEWAESYRTIINSRRGDNSDELIKNGMITCFDWISLGYDRDVIFITREDITHYITDQSNKKEKEYIYKIMRISPNGEIHFRAFASNDSMSDKDQQISGIYEDFKNRYARYPNEIEGIMITNSDKHSVIIKTACTTMPNITSIAKSLEKKPFSRETLLDALSAFKTERPEHSEYINGIEEKLFVKNEISYKYANSCLDIRHNKKAGTALNRFIFANYGIRINPEIKSKDNDEEYLLKNICGIRYYYDHEWDDTKVLAYFVGTKRSSLKTSVHNACVIRKVYSDDVIPEPDKLFRLMSVEFVRNEQYTVIPFPFKYLREYSAY